MEMDDLREMVLVYRMALKRELKAKRELAIWEGRVIAATATALSVANDIGRISGKNAKARKLQSAVLLADDKGVQIAVAGVRDAKRTADDAYVGRVEMEARVSLTKAWLYSQARIG